MEKCITLWIQGSAARNTLRDLRVQVGGAQSIFLGGTWIHRLCISKGYLYFPSISPCE